MKTSGVRPTLGQVDGMIRKYHLAGKDVVTLLKTTGTDLAKADADALIKKYHLTGRDVVTLLKAQDHASAVVAAVRARMYDLNGTVATTTIRTNHYDFYSGGAAAGPPNRTPAHKKAIGGAIAGPGTGTSDDVPIWASNGEHMWTAAEVAAAGGHRRVERLRYLARSGQLHGYAGGGEIRSTGPARQFTAIPPAASNRSSELRVTGRLHTPWGPADIEGIVDDRISSHDAYAQTTGSRR